jgi:hypothetical protein
MGNGDGEACNIWIPASPNGGAFLLVKHPAGIKTFLFLSPNG